MQFHSSLQTCIWCSLLLTWLNMRGSDATRGSETTRCITECGTKFINGVTNSLPAAKDKLMTVSWQEISNIAKGSGITEENQQTVLRVICQEYKAMKHCISLCPRLNTSIPFTAGFNSIEYICVDEYDTFMHSLPCMIRSEGVIMERCGYLYNETYASITQVLQLANKDTEAAYSAMEVFCENNDHAVKCLIPEIQHQCGQEAANALWRLFSLNLQRFLQLYAAVGLNRTPASCNAYTPPPTNPISSLPAGPIGDPWRATGSVGGPGFTDHQAGLDRTGAMRPGIQTSSDPIANDAVVPVDEIPGKVTIEIQGPAEANASLTRIAGGANAEDVISARTEPIGGVAHVAGTSWINAIQSQKTADASSSVTSTSITAAVTVDNFKPANANQPHVTATPPGSTSGSSQCGSIAVLILCAAFIHIYGYVPDCRS